MFPAGADSTYFKGTEILGEWGETHLRPFPRRLTGMLIGSLRTNRLSYGLLMIMLEASNVILAKRVHKSCVQFISLEMQTHCRRLGKWGSGRVFLVLRVLVGLMIMNSMLDDIVESFRWSCNGCHGYQES